MRNYKLITNKIVREYEKIIRSELTGIYLHGSCAMGCCSKNSDIDLLVVVENPLPDAIYRELIDVILSLKNLPAKGIEMSVVLKKYCADFVCPTPFELHYSDYYADKYKSDKSFLCGKSTDEDLACHFMVTKKRGICLTGQPIDEVFAEIPKKVYLDSVFYDIQDAQNQIESDTVYHVLNLCRTLAYIKDGKIMSKAEGGRWALKNIDKKYNALIKQAIREYTKCRQSAKYDNVLLKDFVEYMYRNIKIDFI